MGEIGATDAFTLSAEQREILRSGSLSVVACPGAGKTRALVARFLSRPANDVRGVALLSFTNRAVEEARKRCSSHLGFLQSPNFVGNFDSFIHRFVVTPHFVRDMGHAPNYVRSWSEFHSDDFMIRISAGQGVNLSSFGWQSFDGAFTLLDELPEEERRYIRQVETIPNGIAKLEQAALRRLTGHIESGILDCESARFIANRILGSKHGEILLRRLALRFREVIVDEAHDCDQNEHRILRRLFDAGIDVVIVADPDQAIYEFRGADPRLFEQHRASLPPERRIIFSVSYRSTPAICALATSLRSSEDTVINPCTTPPNGPDCIFLLLGSLAQQRRHFLALTEHEDIAVHQCVVLAHRRNDAKKLAGATAPSHKGWAKTDQIVLAAIVLSQANGVIEERSRAIGLLERVVLDTFDWPSVLKNAADGEKLERLGKTSEWLRVVAARLLRVARSSSEEELGPAIRKVLGQHLSGLSVPLIRLGQNFRRPDSRLWFQFQGTTVRAETSIPFSTVHGAKGGEWPAVLLHIPHTADAEKSPVAHWETDLNSEARRVLYVGATRAQRMLALAIDSRDKEQIERVLRRDMVPFQTFFN